MSALEASLNIPQLICPECKRAGLGARRCVQILRELWGFFYSLWFPALQLARAKAWVFVTVIFMVLYAFGKNLLVSFTQAAATSRGSTSSAALGNFPEM